MNYETGLKTPPSKAQKIRQQRIAIEQPQNVIIIIKFKPNNHNFLIFIYRQSEPIAGLIRTVSAPRRPRFAPPSPALFTPIDTCSRKCVVRVASDRNRKNPLVPFVELIAYVFNTTRPPPPSGRHERPRIRCPFILGHSRSSVARASLYEAIFHFFYRTPTSA